MIAQPIITIAQTLNGIPTKERHDYEGNFRHEIMKKQIHEQ